MLRLTVGLLAVVNAADVVFAPNLDDYYGTKVDVKCSIDRGMEITLTAPLAAKGMRFMLAGDPKCRLEKNGNYHTIQTRLSGCNNEIFMDSSTLTIANTIVNTMTFGRNAVRIESPVGCLFHSQEVSVGILLQEKIPVEIAPTPEPATTTTSPPLYDYEKDDDNVEIGDAPVARGGIPTKEPDQNQPSGTSPPETDDDLSEQGQPPKSDSQEPDNSPKSPSSSPDSQPEGNPDGKPADQQPKTPDNNDYEYTTTSPFEENGEEMEEERVKINFVTRAPTPGGPLAPTSRVTTTTQPRTKELVPGIILIDNGYEFEEEEEDEPFTPVTTDQDEDEADSSETPNDDSTDSKTSDSKSPSETDKPNQIESPRPGFTNDEDDSDQDEDEILENEDTNKIDDSTNTEETDSSNEDDEDENVLEPLPIDPRGCPIPELCKIDPRKGKGRGPKKEKKETLWRVVARGDGLFFARMHLFTDDTFSKAWMYPPSLRTNDTIYAGVILANGPAEATVSLTSCWASNTRHEIVNMKQPELQPNEITLPLIQDGCAVTTPPNLVDMVENGESSQAKFTSSVFQFVGYDTAYLYCRVRVCPLGPCPQTCDGSEPEYEYYDLDVGLGVHGGEDDEEEMEESSGEIFDMPSFDMLIGDDPNGKSNTFDPYSVPDAGPLVAATLYRKYEYAENIKTDGREVVIEKTERTNTVENIFGNSSLMQAVLLGLLGAACCTLVMLSIFVIKKRNREKKVIQ